LSGSEPKILLNADFEGLPALFADSPRPSGERLAMVNAVRMNIAKNVFTSLLVSTLGEVEASSDEGVPEWPLATWKNNLLRMILPYIYPDLDEDSSLTAAFEDYKAGDLKNFMTASSVVISMKLLREGSVMKKSIRLLAEKRV
jgi:hypothetical protein